MEVLDYGATLKSLTYKNSENIFLSFNDLDSYLKQTSYIGQIVGPYCNRIENASYERDGLKYQLEANDGPHHLHGGHLGLDKRYWEVSNVTERSITLRCYLAKSDGVHPANINFEVHYEIHDCSLMITMKALPDRTTIINPTFHGYFKTALFNDLEILSGQYLESNNQRIPTGKVVENRDPINMSADIYDHCFVYGELKNKPMARLKADKFNLELRSSLPGLQFYTGDYLDDRYFKAREGFCLEPQFYPNTPNIALFPQCWYSEKVPYQHTIELGFE
jgi:aldose 1-epimerase